MAAEEDLIEITIWYRGVVEGRLARTISSSLANAARAEGKFAQAFDNYVDLPDRVNVPCRSYARISSTPIAEPYIYQNQNPSIVVATDPALVKGCDVLTGVGPEAVLMVNTWRSPEEILELIKDMDNVSQVKTIATVDAGRGAQPRAPYGAGEGSVDTAVISSTAGPLLGAIAKASGVIGLESLKLQRLDDRALQRGHAEVKVLQNPMFRPGQGAAAPAQPPHFKGRVSLIVNAPPPNGRQSEFISGNFRVLRPVVDQEECTLCRMCWITCPDGCITIHADGSPEKVSIDLDYCKGCGICWNVCPPECIAARDELDFVGGMVRLAY